MTDDRTGPTPDDLGRAAYEGFHGSAFNPWERLDATTKAMWIRAAERVRELLN